MGLGPVTPPPVEVKHTGWADEEGPQYGYHSQDHPFYYNQRTRNAVLGPLGAYHDNTDWPAGMSWQGGSTHGRIDPHGQITWYEPSEIHEKEREEAGSAMARALGSDNHQDITPSSFYDDDVWSDHSPVESNFDPAAYELEQKQKEANECYIAAHQAEIDGDFGRARSLTQRAIQLEQQLRGPWRTSTVVAGWKNASVSEMIHVPGNSMRVHHSDDTPYIYNWKTGQLYHGDEGAFHVDVERHPDLNIAQNGAPALKECRYAPYLRGRYNQERGEVVHHSVPMYGIEEEHLLEPHKKAVEDALGVSEAPAYDWRMSNILDPIHDTLDGRVWDDEGAPAPRMKPTLKKWLLKEIYALAEHFHPNPAKWLRLIITGSLTTYQYSDESDLDISLFVDPHFLPEWSRGQLIGLMVKHMDGTLVPGTPFPLQCFVVPKTISPADLYQHGLRSGYDLEQDHWIVPPDRSRVADVEKEHNIDYVYALESADKMERLLRYDPPRAVDFWHQIHSRRRRDQAAGKGDFSQANIVYKMLANRGLFPELSEASGEYIAALKLPFWKQKRNPLGDYETNPEAAARIEPWTPGFFGKTMYHPSVGVIPPWKTDEFGGAPFHSDVAKHHGFSSMPTSSAWITPEGHVYFPYEPGSNSPPSHLQSVVDAVGPRITHEEAEFYQPDQTMYNDSLWRDDVWD